MEKPNPTFAKIPILDTGKFKQWKFRIQQYLQNEHYTLWEVIEFGDSYEAPQEVSRTGSISEGFAKKKGRTVAVTTGDMQKRRNNVKARTTLLLALPDEHQLRFSKYKTAQELWAAILKTFDGNEATKKTKKNKLNHLEFMDVEIEQDDLNQKFLTSLAPEWLMHTIVWRNRSDLDSMSLDDLYNHFKVYEPEVQKKSESNSQNMAFISSAKNSSGKEEVNITSFSTASTQVSPASADVATVSFSHDTVYVYIASQFNGSQIKYEDINQIDKDDIKEIDIKFCEKIRGLEFKVESKDNSIERLTNELDELKKEKEGLDCKLTGFQSASKDLDALLGSQRSEKNKEGLGYSDVPPPS
uniref:Ribonuclease H-like domain-containing protein n=1 Tax=Tanacetum cinerariifolium TaxID=118510 RepID=A0A699KFE4_TANCI|nr:ribonuclease H-like domain-containing protein [Tanacetum cinerariifolium]